MSKSKTYRTLKWTELGDPNTMTVKLLWTIFARGVMPNVPPESIQYKEMEKAFHSGFFECLKFMDDVSTELSEDEASSILMKLYRESQDFFDKLVKEHPFKNGGSNAQL